MIFLQGFIKFDQGISEKYVGQTFDGRKKERPKCKNKNEKHKNDHRRLLAKQKLMKLDRKNIHI
jgi:hypothetical protein